MTNQKVTIILEEGTTNLVTIIQPCDGENLCYDESLYDKHVFDDYVAAKSYMDTNSIAYDAYDLVFTKVG